MAFGVAERTVTYWRQQGAPIVTRSKNSLVKIADWLRARNVDSKGAATCNQYVTALKGLGRWLTKTNRTETNSFEHLGKLKTEGDIRKRRRVLCDSDFAKLIQSARGSQWTFRGLFAPE